MTTSRKKIAYVTGTRADFGLMTPVLTAITKSKRLSLRVYGTGMHLMPKFGSTIAEVLRVFPRAMRLKASFRDDTPLAQAAFAGALLPKVVSAFSKERPDFVLLLGDRVETLVVALACLYLGIPTGHLHGGERSGTVDEVARHAVSKLASLHFAATADSARRLARMGEEQWRIRVVGAPALDAIRAEKLTSRGELRKKLALGSKEKFILLIQHATSETSRAAGREMRETLAALKSFSLPIVALYPNADPGSEAIIRCLERERPNPFFRVFESLPHAHFLALLRDAAVFVGNSSAALIESASFQLPVVTVGARQRGRVRGENVIAVSCERAAIRRAIAKALSAKYCAALRATRNPWGDGKTAERVVRALEHLPPARKLLAKQIAY
ncbi:MAG: UDP-N-acetylglucosamine 2-epimerase [Patescibacteria group bacterium]